MHGWRDVPENLRRIIKETIWLTHPMEPIRCVVWVNKHLCICVNKIFRVSKYFAICDNRQFHYCAVCDNRHFHCAGTFTWLALCLWSLVVGERNGGGESNICSPVEEREGGARGFKITVSSRHRKRGGRMWPLALDTLAR